MAPVGTIKKKNGRVVVSTSDGEFEASIPFEEVREFLTRSHLRWKLGRYIHENGDEYIFTSFEEFSRTAIYILLRKGRLSREEADKASLLLKTSEVDAVVGGLFLRLFDCKLVNDRDECKRIVGVFVDIAKAYAKLVIP
ncbi:MAG: hypothetical protein ACO2PN_16160 [Pyrobaculum sp.]|jgi:hypothetical protein